MSQQPYVETEGESTLGVMAQRETVEQMVRMSGLWDGQRAETHKFILSPSLFRITPSQADTLRACAAALQDTLAGLSRIAAIAADNGLGSTKTWAVIRQMLSLGVPKAYRDIQFAKPTRIPGICKVDFMLGEDGKFYIAEIDGHNKHGLGYTTLIGNISRALAPQAERFPGVPELLGEYIKKRTNGVKQATLLYGDQERFYLPEFNILRDNLQLQGVQLDVISETDFNPVSLPDRPLLFIDFPFLYRRPELNTVLAEKYKTGDIDFVIPPKPWFGAKTVLALLRNDLDNPEWDAILRSHIPAASLELTRSHLPRTFVITKDKPREYWTDLVSRQRFVLKESISSGMKGTVFSDDPEFPGLLDKALTSPNTSILQEEVANAPQLFQYFGEDGNTYVDSWFMRVTVFFSMRQVVEIDVTARRDKKVHGAKDCIQIGTIIVD